MTRGSDGTSAVLSVAREVAGIVRRQVGDPVYRVVLFGSWAQGAARERSDVDIGIDGPTPVDPVTLQEIREACERLPTLYTIDLVDFATLSPAVRERARTAVVPIDPAPWRWTEPRS